MTFAIRVLILCLLCLPAVAQQRVDLYRADMLVADQSQAERNRATVDGLAEVVVRASGQPRVLENPHVIEALSQASNYLVEWRYETSEQTLTVDSRDVPAWRLVLRYSGNAIEKLLRDLHLPVWPANRPSMLTWLVVDTPRGRTRVSPSSEPEVLALLEASAKRRGIPVIKPLMDLDDQVALPVNSLWSFDRQAVAEASERYNPDSILLGRLTQTSLGRWRAGWLLIHRGQTTAFDDTGMQLEDVVAKAIDQVADYFFQLYGIIPREGSSEALLFQVDGVNDFANYARVMDYLQGLAVIRRYDLVAVRGGSLLLYVYPAGDVGLLRDALALDERLIPHVPLSQANASLGGMPSGSPGNPLRYRWR